MPNRARPPIIAIGLLLGLAGCAHQWTPGPARTTADLAPIQARCRLSAGYGSGFGVSGSWQAVLIASAVHAVAEGIAQQAKFNDCMQASGFLMADAPSAATVQPVMAEPLPPPEPAPANASQAAASAALWAQTQRVLNHPSEGGKADGLYQSLCSGGDASACMMAAALDPRRGSLH